MAIKIANKILPTTMVGSYPASGTSNSYWAATSRSRSKKPHMKKRTRMPWQPWFAIRKMRASTS